MVTNRDRQEIIWLAPKEKNPIFPQKNDTVDVFDPCSGISGLTLQRAAACPKLHE